MRVFCVAACALLGCSGSGDPGAPGAAGSGGSEPNGGRASSAGNAAGGSAGIGGASSGGKAGAASAGRGGMDTSLGEWKSTLVSLPLRLRGEMALTQWAPPEGGDQYAVFAQFGMLRGQWDGCTRHQLASCWYYDCPEGSAPVGTPPVGPLQSIGTSLIVESSTTRYTLYYDEKQTYSEAEFGRFWPYTGGTISFVASGTPPFRVDVPAPPFVKLLTVNGRPPQSPLQRAAGAKLTWQTSGAGSVFFSIYRLTGSAPRAAVCGFEAARQAGELPASVLEKLEPGDDYELTLRGDERVVTTADAFELEALALSYADGEEMTVPIQLQ